MIRSDSAPKSLVTPTAPNLVWTADPTYIWTAEGWLYLAVVLDLFNPEVISRSLKPRMTADIVIDALTMAWFRRRPAPGPIHHSERGSQVASHAFQTRLKKHHMTCSMSRKGNCWGNAPTERFFNSFKNERVHGTRYETRQEPIADAIDYIEPFYNRRRRQTRLATPRHKTCRRTGSGLSMSTNWRHNAVGLKDEQPRETQYRNI